MWNPFRRKPSEAAFPKPEWPPIQNFDSVDLTGKRRDGGVDLVIVASQPLDDSEETLASIRQKVETYLEVVDIDEFQSEMGHPPRNKTSIVIACDYPIHPAAMDVIKECETAASAKGIKLVLRQES